MVLVPFAFTSTSSKTTDAAVVVDVADIAEAFCTCPSSCAVVEPTKK